ncbi:MAG: hypothetical protein B7C54_07530 [Acidimicrobiales bacterium mtb01]|nr:ACT domain-containing protein [Actinomycetota bacterium]TEX44980.1 MAG: hypothetical protein B7C54_07530 [Acidimicrobiales bacterium mtb01]
MSVHVIRLWLPDRPGTLGRVAAAIGSVGADVTGIEILERGAGMAIDEVTIDVPDSTPVDDVVSALSRVDGVAVEDVHRIDDERLDHGVVGLHVLADFIESDRDLDVLSSGLRRLLESDWVAVVDRGRSAVVAASGDVPDPSWLIAFLAGTIHLDDAGSEHTPSDVIWAHLAGTELSFASERRGRAFRAREREHVSAIGRVAGASMRRA